MRRIAWIGLAVVLGAGVWLLLRDTARTPTTQGTERSPTTSPGDRPVLVGSPVDLAPLPAGFAPPPPPGREGTGPVEDTPAGSGRILGQVVDVATGAGAAGAWVHAAPLHADPPFPHAVADAEGQFEIEDVPAGHVFVVVLGGGWHGSDVGDLRYDMMSPTPSKAIQIDADETERVELEAVRAASVEGRVFDAGGREVAGARVRPIATPRHYDSWRIPAESLEATSAADGSFRLDTLVAGLQYRVQALTADVAPGLSEPFHADPDVPAHVDVHLPPLRTLELEVRSAAEGTRIPNAAAAWVVADPAALIMNHEYSAEGNGEGRIHVGPLAPGALNVEVSAGGFASKTVKLTPEDEGEIHRVVSLELGLALAGQVLDRDGRAVPGAWITCGRDEAGRNQTASTDEEGAFRFEGLLAGDWTLAVWVGDGTADLTVQVEAGREDLVLRVEQTFKPGLLIHVLDPDGQPIPRFEVVTATAFGMGAGDWEDGRFEIEAGQDVEYVELRRARDAKGVPLGYAPALIDVRDRSQGERTVRLEPGASIEGVVLGPDGRGVPGLSVSSAMERPRGFGMLTGPEADTQSDADGRFRLVGVASGRHRLFVTVPVRYAPVPRQTVTAGATGLTIRLQEGASFQPRIVDAGGAAIAGARVQVTRLDGGGLCWELSGGDGAVHLAGLLRDGWYGLEVYPPEDRIDMRALELEAWRPSDQPIVLEPARVIRGRVVDSTGRPVVEATVTSRELGGAWSPTTQTDAEGRFVLGGVATGPVELRAHRFGEPALGSACVQVTAPESTGAGDAGVELVAEPLVELAVRIEGASHPPVRGDFRYKLQSASGDAWPQAVEAGVGHFLVRPDACYDLHFVLAEDGLVAWREGIRGDAGAVSVACVPAKEIRGRVLVPSDALSIKVRVEERGVSSECTPEADGTFQLQGLPAGTWRVNARVLRSDGAMERSVTAEIGAEVTIDLR